MSKYYHVFYLWKRIGHETWTPQCEVTDKHPYDWDKEYRDLETEAEKNTPYRSLERHTITGWNEISKEEYDKAVEMDLYG